MTPSQQAKAQGFKSLAQVAELSTVKRRTLENWHKDKPELFDIVLLGCLAKAEELDFKDAPVQEMNANSAFFSAYGG